MLLTYFSNDSEMVEIHLVDKRGFETQITFSMDRNYLKIEGEIDYDDLKEVMFALKGGEIFVKLVMEATE